MIDLAISETGDLVFINNKNKTQGMNIKFCISDAKLFQVKFKIEDSQPVKPLGDNYFKISFNVSEYDNNKKPLVLKDNDALAQLVMIRLTTALESMKHQKLYDPKVMSSVKSIVTNTISDLIPNVKTEVVPEVSTSVYTQKLVVYIYDGSNMLLSYDIKG